MSGSSPTRLQSRRPRGAPRVALALALALIVSGSGRAERAAVAAAGVGGDLQTALTLLPAGMSSVAFTDWATLKRYAGLPAIDGTHPLAARLNVLIRINRTQGVPSAFGIEFAQTHARDWGWDSTDLLWEASGDGNGPPLYLLRLRDSFSFAPLRAHFRAHGFSAASYHGVQIYSHGLDAAIAQSTDLAIANTALLPARHLLVLSAGLTTVQATLDTIAGAAPALAGQPAAPAAAARLAPTAAAVLTLGTSACVAVSSAQLGLHAYQALGLGYRQARGRVDGIVVLHYADRRTAQSDLPRRRRLAATGSSLAAHLPYARAVFTLAGATVRGTDLVLNVLPVHNRPQVLFTMFDDRDMAFAGCSGAP